MRAIIHIDLDAFFCSVEVLKNPTFEGKPIVVGGRSEERGVVAAASYPSREFGIHSAMPMARAKQLCKDLIILPPRFSRYKTYSRVVMGILRNVSPVMQQVSIDEAYLDLTSRITDWNESIDIARKLQLRILRDIGLSSSIGIATNKMVAKVASDFNKPAGFTVVNPGDEQSFLAPMVVRKIPGIGPKTSEKLTEINIQTVRDLSQMAEKELRWKFGKLGTEMTKWAKGIDERPVIEEHKVKSISKERTFVHDITQRDDLYNTLQNLTTEVAKQLEKEQLTACTIFIKIRYSDFSTLTRQHSLSEQTNSNGKIYQVALYLLKNTWKTGQPVRLLGVGCKKLSKSQGQLELLL